MEFVLSSTNIAKRNATEKTLKKFYPEAKLTCIDVDSGVSKTPVNDDEGILGCLNRIEQAKKKMPDAYCYIGLEGIITKNSYGTFICGWCVVEMNNIKGMGCSAKVEIPRYIADKITSFGELSSLVKNTYKSELVNRLDEIGTNGVITNLGYTRVDEFEDALNCAFGYISNSNNY